MMETAWRLGVGVGLGWAALPLLVRLARRVREGSPASYYRALVLALAIGTALLFAPAMRGFTGLELALPVALRVPAWADARSISFAAEWVNPWHGSPSRPVSFLSLSGLLAAAGGVWSLVVALGVVQALRGRAALWRRYQGAQRAPARVLERARQIAAELGVRLPELRVASDASTAFTFGIFAPVIVLDAASCQADDAALEFTLRHELLHVARSDARAAFWIDLAQRCFTGHPSLRGLAAEIRFAREATVDAAAAGTMPLEYARFLLALAERVRSARSPAAHLVSMADTTLKRRVEMLIKAPSPRRFSQNSAWLGLAGLALGALVFLAPSSWGLDAGSGGADHTIVRGNLSVEQVEKAFFSQQGRIIHECYAPLLTWPRPNVTTRVLFDIAEDGGVSRVRAIVPEHPELEPCLEAVVASTVFPAPSSGTASVDVPAMLTPPLDERNARAQADHGVGRLPREVIQKVVRDSYPRFADCYETLPEPRPELTVKLDFTIGRDGQVIDGQVIDGKVVYGKVGSKDRPEFASCVEQVMRALVFPAPEGGIVTVGYPLVFAP